jgi:ABC-type polysaccharide/polyol phosphate export permease
MFLVYGAIFMVIFVGIWLMFTRRGGKTDSVSLWTALAIILLSFVVCIISACCLLITALFRKKDYIPPPPPEEELLENQKK